MEKVSIERIFKNWIVEGTNSKIKLMAETKKNVSMSYVCKMYKSSLTSSLFSVLILILTSCDVGLHGII